jgi:hypothetical protein
LFEFPSPGVFAGFDPTGFAMPFASARTLMPLREAAADGRLHLSVDADPDEQRARLLELSGIGPWTADYVLMRAMSHPDILLTKDLGGEVSAGTRRPLGRWVTRPRTVAFLRHPSPVGSASLIAEGRSVMTGGPEISG